MPYNANNTYEFTAFNESDLVSGNLNRGSTFTMPGGASTQFSVSDDDNSLSGDNWRNENANDRYGQTAQIMSNGQQVGNGGQIYAESYFWVRDQNNHWYVMIQIEQEGSNAEYFTFLNGYGYSTPPEGAQLTVVCSGNVCGNWLKFSQLGAGEKVEPETGTISGRLTFDEDNNDNEWNEETNTWDKGVEGQVVELQDIDGNVVATATTDSYGNYTFADISIGDYRVNFPLMDGYEFSAKDSGVNDHYDSDSNANGLTNIISLKANQTINTIDAGIKIATGTLSGRVFNDENNDGIDNSGNSLGDNLIVNGDFENHPNLQYGRWGTFNQIEGWVATKDKIEIQEGRVGGTKNIAGNAVVEMDAHANATIYQDVNITEMGRYQFSLDYAMRGNNVSTNGVAVYVDGTLQATVYPNSKKFETLVFEIDLDVGDARIELKGLGKSDSYGTIIDNVKLERKNTIIEEGQEGVRVYLLDENGNEVLDSNGQAISTVTDNHGEYSFEGVAIGNYRVRLEIPEGKEATKHNAGSDDTIDSDINKDGISDVVAVKSGTTTSDVDAGFIVSTGTIAGRLTFDSDNNDNEWNEETGAWDEGVQGQVVELQDINGKVIAVATTDSYGSYTFADIPVGDYKVEFPLLHGYEFSAKDSGVDDHYDSDANEEGLTDVITVKANQTINTVDAGIKLLTGSITGHVFNDENKDGLETLESFELGDDLLINGDFEENALNNTGSSLGKPSGLVGWYDIGSAPGQVHEQDYGHGNVTGDAILELEYGVVIYQEVNVPEAGDYRMSFEVTRRGDSDQNNTFELLIDGELYDTYIVTENKTIELDLDLNSGSHRFDFKSLSTNVLEDNAYKGAGLDDVKLQKKMTTVAEEGQEGVIVYLLDENGNEVLDSDGEAISTITDSHGEYSFEGIAIGNYRVRLETPEGKEATKHNVGSDETIDSDINKEGISDVIAVRAGATTSDIDAGLIVSTGSIAGRLTFDSDSNDNEWNEETGAWEKGVEGQVVELQDPSGKVVATATTDSNGAYSFDDIPVGDYRVNFPLLEGYEFSAQDSGVDDHYDSDASASGLTDIISIKANQNINTIDAGIKVLTGTVTGRLTFDSDNNDNEWNEEAGAWDKGVEGQVVELQDTNGKVVVTATTDSNGAYTFANIPVGDYKVKFPLLDGYEFSVKDSGVDDHYDSDANTNGLTETLTVKAYQTTNNVDAGIKLLTGSIAGRVFNDDNKDGLDNSGDELGANLIINGDFENHPSLQHGNWGTFNKIEGWVATRDKIEIQEGRVGGTQNTSGNAVVEMDAHANATIQQDVNVTEEGTYQFSLDYAMRGNNVNTNGVAVYVDGKLQATVYPDSKSFETLTFEIDLDVGNARIELKGLGQSDSYGTIIDNVTLQKKAVAGEEGQEGVTVYLLDENGNEVLDGNGQAISTVTDSNGEYSFEGIAIGNYRVKFETPEDKEATKQNVGSDDTIDSDINEDGISDVISVEGGKETANVDAGYIDAHVCVRMLEGDTSFKVDFDSHTNIVTEDVWFAHKILDPGSARIVGDHNITEGSTKSYKLQFDEVVAEDTYVTIKINDGSAKQAGSSVEEFIVYYPQYNSYNFGTVQGETVQYYTTSQYHQNKVESIWYNDPIYKHGQIGNADDNYVGVHNLVNDYKIIGSNGQEVTGATFTVKVPAGSSMSESFEVVANKEVNVGKHTFNLFGTESTEHFSLEVTQIGERTDVEGQKTISITDVAANVSPIAFDLNANGEIDVTGDSTARDHAFKAGARTVEFDLDNDGKAETIEWLKGDGDGFLVDTRKISSNNDIDGGALFGDEGGKYTDGYEKLALHDSNNDGVLTGGELSNLAIWVDDGDAVLEDGELRQLSEFGITELSTTGQNAEVSGEQLLRSETRVNAESVNKVTYSITGVDAEFFQIDPNTGEVTYADGFVPDYENPLDDGSDNVYNIQVVRSGSDLEEPEIEHLCVKIEDKVEFSSISGRVFLDDNSDGLDNNEEGQSGVKVYLLDTEGNQLLDGNKQPITTVTGDNGEYTFANIAAGEYRVKFDTPAQKIFTTQNVGKFDTIDSDVNAQGISDIVTVIEGIDVSDVDAGLIPEPTGSISGRMFLDDNCDGLDINEGGQEGVTVYLLDKYGQPILDSDNQAITTETGANGEYTFDDIVKGEYRVKFDTPAHKLFTTQNVGKYDAIDSDVNEQGISDIVTVGAGQDIEDVDAGVKPEPTGTISGRIFLDNNDGLDNNEEGRQGVEVQLLDEDGNAVLDSNDQPITVTTNANGEYTFEDVFADNYRVKFVVADGVFTQQNAGSNDSIDSDVNANGVSDVVVVKAGENVTDVDAGLANRAPELSDDQAKACYDETVHVDVLENDKDLDADTLTITAVNGQAITEGGPAIAINGILVSLVGGKLVFDGASAHADLIAGETAVDTFSYTVSDGRGGEGVANVEVTFHGATDTLEKVEPLLTDLTIGFQVIADDFNVGRGVGDGAFSAKLSDAGDNLNGFYDKAYCLDIFASVQPGGYGTNIDHATLTGAEVTIATTDYLSESQQSFLGTGGINGESAADNLDLINWIINQDFEETDNGDGNNQTYTGAEVQGAIWALTNGEALESFGEPGGVYVDERFGTDENAQEIIDLALISGEGFEAGEGDLVGIYVDPTSSPNFVQPFIVGVNLFEECSC